MAKMRKMLRIIVILSVMYAGIAFGAEITPIPGTHLRQGERAPAEGVLFFQDSLIAIANALQEREQLRAERDNLQAQVGTLKAESEELQTAIGQLKEANQKLQLANDKADFMISNFQTILNLYKQALVNIREDNKSLRNELFWNKILGALPIVGLVAALIGGF